MARFIFLLTAFWFTSSPARSKDLLENLNITSRSAVGFDELYNDGLLAYKNENWATAVKLFEQAIADFRHEQEVNVHCRVTCRHLFSSKTKIKDLELQYFKFSIYNRECVRRCVEKYRGKRSFISKHIRNAFEVFRPYGFLQFAYYKNGQTLDAVRAAFTFLEKHPNDDTMLDNMKYYKRLPHVTDDKIISLEPVVHQDHYFAGAKLYEKGYWTEAIEEIELALKEYYKAYAKCQMLCEEQAERNQILGRGGLFGVHVSVIGCRTKCPDHLRTVRGFMVPNYLARHYNYLQLAYFKLNDLVKAAESVITYLLFNPSDDTMIDNMRYYRGYDEVRYGNIHARKDAEEYHRTTTAESKLLHIALGYLDDESDEEFDDGNEDNEQESPLEDLAEGEVEDYSADSLSGLGKPKDLSQIKTHEELLKDPRFEGVKVVMADKQLNGSERVLVDGMASEEQCKELMELARKTAKLGDGYTSGQDSPFTTKENFEGVTIKAATEAVEEERANFDSVELYANMSEKMRSFVEDYFQMETPLFVSYVHLVCRTSLLGDEEMNSPVVHLSHPIHSDNCLLHRNGPGTCPKRRPAYTWRDYSAILYLNGDFEGGNFIFAHNNNTIQAEVKPQCGRLVAFSAGAENLHGVLGIKRGRRCALPIWFTLRNRDEAHEDSHEEGIRLLERLRQRRKKFGQQSGQKVQFETMGQSHSEL